MVNLTANLTVRDKSIIPHFVLCEGLSILECGRPYGGRVTIWVGAVFEPEARTTPQDLNTHGPSNHVWGSRLGRPRKVRGSFCLHTITECDNFTNERQFLFVRIECAGDKADLSDASFEC